MYQPDYSKPIEGLFVFAYRMHITNHGTTPARLLRRRWRITDGTGQVREVEGEGVVGQQPLILPGQTHSYVSWIQLAIPLGTMEGDYTMEGLLSPNPHDTPQQFKVPIPRFLHLAPELAN